MQLERQRPQWERQQRQVRWSQPLVQLQQAQLQQVLLQQVQQ
jgi:hypothetical protein